MWNEVVDADDAMNPILAGEKAVESLANMFAGTNDTESNIVLSVKQQNNTVDVQQLFANCNAEAKTLTDVHPLDFPDDETYDKYMENIQDQLADLNNKKNQTQEILLQTSCAERQLMRLIKQELANSGNSKIDRKGAKNETFSKFDEMERKRRKEEEDKLYEEKI